MPRKKKEENPFDKMLELAKKQLLLAEQHRKEVYRRCAEIMYTPQKIEACTKCKYSKTCTFSLSDTDILTDECRYCPKEEHPQKYVLALSKERLQDLSRIFKN